MSRHTTEPGGCFLVLDADLPDRPPLAHATDWEQALNEVDRIHGQFLDQVEANGEGSGGTQLAVTVVGADQHGHRGPVLRWFSCNGIRPTHRFP